VTVIQADAPIVAPHGDVITITVYGQPAPQGSKRHLGGGVMIEMSKKVKPWRQDVKAAALDVMTVTRAGHAQSLLPPLDGPLAASIVFTMRDQPTSRPTWWPRAVKWSKSMRWRPASTPDLSKLLRSTEDALTGVIWKDDARVVEYQRLAKYYTGDDAPDVLDRPGAVIRVWPIGGAPC
jgi:Holliday junction resolvase RusA-like endonuclease